MKRFTETMKWDDAWFMGLSAKQKLLWMYITDKCDNAGVYEINYPIMSAHLGETITQQDFEVFNDEFKTRVKTFRKGTKLLIRDFVEFQIMNLNTVNSDSKLTNLQKNCVASVVKYIDSKELTPDDYKLITGKVGVLYEYLTGIGKGIGNSNGNGNSIGKDHAEKIIATWNSAIKGSPLTKLERWTPRRSTHYRARLNEWDGTEDTMWAAIREQASNLGDFAKGKNDRNWVITFDWIMSSEQNFTKFIEGNYRYKGTHR